MKKVLGFLMGIGLAGGFVANAQTPGLRPAPHVGYVYPAGGQQGSTFDVSVGGELLNGASRAYFSGDGVHAKVLGFDRPLTQKEINDLREKMQELQDKRAAAKADATKPAFTPEDEKTVAEIRTKLANRPSRPANPALAETVTLEVSIDADATLGQRELRLKTTAGLSNPFAFIVGPLPEASDPVVTATMIEPRKDAGKAERSITLPATVNGQILPGEIDRFQFSARRGQRLTIAAAARALNPYLADAVPGWFQATLAIYDAKGREVAYDDDYRFHPDPVLGFEVPSDGDYVVEIKDALHRGREDFVYRVTLGELPFVTGIFPLGGRGGGPIKFDVSGWNLPATELVVDALDRPRGTSEFVLRHGGGVSNAVPFAVDDLPSVAEREPNDQTVNAQALAWPAVIDGRIQDAADRDVFSFEAPAGTKVVAEIRARRLESPLDSTLEVIDAHGKRVAFNDDTEDKAAGLLTHQADSRVAFAVPEDGIFFVRVTDAQGRGGPDFAYRLYVGPPRPDFALRVVPSTINVRAGTSVPITVYAVRRDGFDGEILLGLDGAPSGFALSGGRIPARQDKVQLTLTAPFAPRDEPVGLKLLGFAFVDGQRIAHSAGPADDMMQAFAYHHLVVAQEWKVDVTGRGPVFRTQSHERVRIPSGGTARIRIATPGARGAGELHFELFEPIAGLEVKECVPDGDYVEVVIACDAGKIKGKVEGNLLLHAVGVRRGNGPGTPPRIQRNALGFVPAIPFEIVAAIEPSA